MMMEQMTRVAMQQSMEENSRKVPPASERVRDALPRIVVTKDGDGEASGEVRARWHVYPRKTCINIFIFRLYICNISYL